MTQRDVRMQAAIVEGGRLLLIECMLPNEPPFWLLPGGGREIGETDAEAVAREVREELGVDVSVGEMIDDVVADPPDGTYTRWRTYVCALTGGTPAPGGSDGWAQITAMRWLSLAAPETWDATVTDDPFLNPQLMRLSARLAVPNVKRTLRLVDSDPAWAARYATEAARIHAAVAAHVLAIEHVGSTSVPGLVAKPVIDIAIAVSDARSANACVAPLEAIGYGYRGTHGDDPRRRYYVLDVDGVRAAQLHLYILPASAWDAMLRFRDALRSDPRLVAAYADEKRRVADLVAWDKAEYSLAKGPFIAATLEQLASE